jgi:hypothetical protein
MKSARCKFTVTSIDNGTINMTTQYDGELAKEDNSFSKTTPWGNMSFGLNNPNLDGFFKPGQAYYIDITPVPTAQPDKES